MKDDLQTSVFWVDANVLIQAKNDYYAFDIAPGFWQILLSSAGSGRLSSPENVFTEIARGGDELSSWAKGIRGANLFKMPTAETQSKVRTIANFVTTTYDPAQVGRFLSGADPWVIGSAWASGGVVVTLEKPVGPDSKKIKIPNICKKFGVDYVNSSEMIRGLGGKLIS